MRTSPARPAACRTADPTPSAWPWVVLLPSALLLAAPLFGLAPGPAAADVTTGLLASYSFDGHADDDSPNANHGTIVNGVTFVPDRLGNPGAAAEFDGISSYVFVPNSPSLNAPVTELTQAAWISLDGMSLVGSQFAPILMKSTSAANVLMYRMYVTQSVVGVSFNDWNTSSSAAAALSLAEWYHVATVYDGAEVRTFVNGVLIDAQPFVVSIVPNTLDLTIGADFPGLLEVFYGRMDDVRIYSRALSDLDVAELYGSPVTAVPQIGPANVLGHVGEVYPNPMTANASLDYALARGGSVRVTIHDVHGRHLATLPTGIGPGDHTARWNGRDDRGRTAPAGVYFFRVQTPQGIESRRVTRIR